MRTKGLDKGSLPEQVKKSARKPAKKIKEPIALGFPTGCTVLNLACSDTSLLGYGKGKIVNVIGDSHAGKTLLNLTMLAEASVNKSFDKHDLYYDDVEAANEFDFEKMFGPKMAKRVKLKGSDDIDEWLGALFEIVDKGRPFIYVLDSLDALMGEKEDEKVRKKLEQRLKNDPKAKGDYGDGKAKGMSRILRIVKKRIKEVGGLVIVISQTRDKIDASRFESKKTRSGGKALQFYSTHVIWLAVIKPIKKTVKGIDDVVGSIVRAKVSKNKLTGKERRTEFLVYDNYGIDDIESCIEFMIKCKAWSRKKGGDVDTKGDIDVELMKVSDLAKHIEDNNMERRLKRLVAQQWAEREETLEPKRKAKYK